MVIKSTRYGGVNMITHRRDIPLLLVGTAIDSKHTNVKGMHSAIINVKNERKYSPVASRDALDDKAIELLQDQINNDISIQNI